MRAIAWFSCGAASAVASKLATEKYGDSCRVVYCDVSRNEHPDNERFRLDVEKWIGREIELIRSEKFTTIEEVFEYHSFMSGPRGAKCTVEMKKVPRFAYQQPGDIHLFGFTADKKELKRIERFEENNHDLKLDWILRDNGIKKSDCYRFLVKAGIAIPKLYEQGYQNNNCIGCVKATSPAYWNLVRKTNPEIFESRAKQSRQIGCRLVRFKGERIYLDELPEGDYGRYKPENISCGPECGDTNRN